MEPVIHCVIRLAILELVGIELFVKSWCAVIVVHRVSGMTVVVFLSQ